MSSKPVRAPTEMLSLTKPTGISIVYFVLYSQSSTIFDLVRVKGMQHQCLENLAGKCSVFQYRELPLNAYSFNNFGEYQNRTLVNIWSQS